MANAFTSEVIKRIDARCARDPALDSATTLVKQSPEGQAVLAAALTAGSAAAMSGAKPELWSSREEVERLVDAAATAADDHLRTALRGLGREVVLIDQCSFASLLFDADGCSLEVIARALARADHGEAAVRALARAGRKEELPFATVAEIIAGISRPDLFLGLVGRAVGDVPGGLVTLLEGDRFGDEAEGAQQRMLALYALWSLGDTDTLRPLLRRSLRQVARGALSFAIVGLLLFMANTIADPDVDAIIGGANVPLAHELGEAAASLAAEALHPASMADVVAVWPWRAAAPTIPGVPPQPATKAGRNEACPCGSGKKFKKCCASTPGARRVLLAPTRDEILQSAATRLKAISIERMAASDLARIDPSVLNDAALMAWLRRQIALRDWGRAGQATNEVATRASLSAGAKDARLELVRAALAARRYDVAGEHMARVPEGGAIAEGVALAIAQDQPGALADLRAFALKAIEDDSCGTVRDLALLLLHTDPGLGILIARGAVRPDQPRESVELLHRIEDARADLLLAPTDGAARLYIDDGGQRAEAGLRERADRMTQAAAELQTRLQATRVQLLELERRDAQRAAELEEARRRGGAAESGQRDSQELRAKVQALQAQIREGNTERAALRRELADAGARASASAVNVSPAAPKEDLAEDAMEETRAGPPRNVLTPRFSRDAEAALSLVPRTVATQGLHAVSGLAAGESGSWRGVKQAKGMPSQVLSARIGIHYRLLFRIDRDVLEVLDLVSRERLLTVLKRLRAG